MHDVSVGFVQCSIKVELRFVCFLVERKAIDERRNVELALEGANQMVSELRIALSGAEGRTSALDTQLAR